MSGRAPVAAALAAGALACALGTGSAGAEQAGPPESEPQSVTVAVLPHGFELRDLASVEGISPGAMSAGLSTVPAIQTYLDISQGNRVFTSLYDEGLPVLNRFGEQVPEWGVIADRAETAPAEIVPGLLASTLRDSGVPVRADSLLVTPALVAADRGGRVARTAPLECLERRCPGVAVVPATVSSLPQLVGRLRGSDLLIAFQRPPPDEGHSLALGIAGEGFDGTLTSDTTRRRGLVLSTDLAPTILERFGIESPDQFSGEPIRAEGEPDAEGLAERVERLELVTERRNPVILANLAIWAMIAALAALATSGRLAPAALTLLGLSAVYLPLMLLAGAAIEPSELEERLLVGIGSPALAALTLAALRGWSALAVACAITVAAYAVDVIAGSPLTARSLLGPNPILGVRFFGIGNELEATLAVLIPVGVGAGLVAAGRRRGRPPGPSVAIASFLVAGTAFAALFAAGRFGADVGAAIVFPAGAAIAALAVPGALRGRRRLLLLLGAPLAGFAALAAIDLALGGDAHLSRSVFEAGGADEVADVLERRLRLSASSFVRAIGLPLFWFAVAAVVAAVWFRERILSWLEGAPLARAGMAGAAGAIAIGTVANDSGATFLTIGTVALLACLAFAYAQNRLASAEPRRVTSR